ncbi:MAG: GNAT family N-acetyltransferase [Crocinitomicaceae bacterium]|nr:GNAT family N-acetyltransferase [Flavobacteriales bacterium]NQZ36557.1 GNAT family N-acetyltransferase [Crocinitomicaceae bacterium]
MNNYSINHLFDFWEYLGTQGGFFTNENGYKYSSPSNMSWPTKVFGIDIKILNIQELASRMKEGYLPNSLGIIEDTLTEKLLLSYHFKQTSVVKGMCLNLTQELKPVNNFHDIQEVDTEKKAIDFATIASKCFGYEINPQTIISLLSETSKIRLYLGKHMGSLASCGIVFLDKNNVSGIHMIGTIQEYQGLGLGKTMTNKLIFEAYENKSSKVVLVASKAGERIYTKLGFIAQGNLKNYSISE